MTDLERKFFTDMRDIYIIAKKELGYTAARFLQLLSEKGGVDAARILISKDGGTYGFEVLYEKKRLDLSVEALVLKKEYYSLFSEEEREICRKRLMDYHYNVIE